MVGQSTHVLVQKFKREIYTYYYLLVDPATPAYFKFLPLLVFIAYFLFPFDLLPDFIPFIGYVDDVVFLWVGIIVAMRFIPTDSLERCRRKAEEKISSSYLLEWIFIIWILLSIAIGIGIIILIQSFFF